MNSFSAVFKRDVAVNLLGTCMSWSVQVLVWLLILSYVLIDMICVVQRRSTQP